MHRLNLHRIQYRDFFVHSNYSRIDEGLKFSQKLNSLIFHPILPIMSSCSWFHFCEGCLISPQNEIGNASHSERNYLKNFLFSEVLTKMKPRRSGQYGSFEPGIKRFNGPNRCMGIGQSITVISSSRLLSAPQEPGTGFGNILLDNKLGRVEFSWSGPEMPMC
jgi:hypothetical protein